MGGILKLFGNVNFEYMCEKGLFPKGKCQDYFKENITKRKNYLLRNNYYPKEIYNSI